MQYARELALWGIETSIIVPGAFTGGTNHFAHSGTPANTERAPEYEAGPYRDYGKKSRKPLPPSFHPTRMRVRWRKRSLRSLTRPFGKRPFRVNIDPTQDGAEVAFGVIDRVRTEMLHRVGLQELLTPVKN